MSELITLVVAVVGFYYLGKAHGESVAEKREARAFRRAEDKIVNIREKR